MKVTELANELNTTADTVQYYTRIGLITPIKSPANGYKIYGKTVQRSLKFILSARQLDFSVEEIKAILTEADKGKTALLLREKLRKATRDWQSKPDKAPTGHMICHLIEGGIDE